MPSYPWQQLPFQEAIDYFATKQNIDTDSWRDLQGLDYDVAFAVAGAKGALLQDMRDAVEKAITEGTTLQEFRKDFDRIVQSRGWSYSGDRDWRTNTIYNTNLRTAYAGGRWEQIQQNKAKRPYLQWRHGGSRDPRPLHIALDRKVFSLDDPFWQSMGNPPIGHGCRCSVFALGDRDLERLKLKVEKAPVLGSEYGGIPVEPDPGWGGGHGRSNPEQRRKLLVSITQRLQPELAVAVEQEARFASLRFSQEFGAVEKSQMQAIRDRSRQELARTGSDDLRRADGLYSVIQEMADDSPQFFRGVIDGLGDLQASAIVTQSSDSLVLNHLVSSPWNLRGMPKTGQQLKGAGGRLMADVARESIELGYEGRIRLSASPEARHYYENFGFVADGNRMVLTPSQAQNLIGAFL
jgi:SPP1 gp7 family putative phage head morphogenesis protein